LVYLVPGASLGLKMYGGQQAEPLRAGGVWRRRPQRGSGVASRESSCRQIPRWFTWEQCYSI